MDCVTRADELKRELSASPRELDRLFGIITDAFIDKHGFEGRKLNYLIPSLIALLRNYDKARVADFLENPPPRAG